MRVSIAVPGRFHAFHLAEQLHARGHLHQLMTSFPSFIARRFGIPGPKTHSFVVLEAFHRMLTESGIDRAFWNPQHFFHSTFDAWAARELDDSADLLVGWSGGSLESIRRAKKIGMRAIVVRGSSHMSFQYRILSDEFATYGLSFNETHPQMVKRELTEYAEADYVMVPSSFAKKTFIDEGFPAEKILLNPLGVNPKHYSKQPRTDKNFRIIFCGMVGIRKGVHTLVQAFNELKLPKAELWLIGAMTPEFHTIARDLDFSNVKIKGIVPRRTLPVLFSQGDVFCLPSLEDGFGVVIAQAMACELPAVISLNSAGEDLVRDGSEGFVVPARNVEKLKEKILWCYEHPKETREMGHRALVKIQQGFTWNDFGDRTVQIYERVLKSEPPKHRDSHEQGVDDSPGNARAVSR